MQRLKDKHLGQTAWIIGKGPSLAYLTKEDIGEGPVIAINESIIKIESLDLSNPTYSMQKDGGRRRKYFPSDSPECDCSPNCDGCQYMTKPKKATLLVHNRESLFCFPDYSPRYVFDWRDLGMPRNDISLVTAIRMGQFMGCTSFKFVCCDLHAFGDMGVYDVDTGAISIDTLYQWQPLRLKAIFTEIDHKFITPRNYVPPKDLKVSFGVISNDAYRLNTVFCKSDLPGELHYYMKPESATKGLNVLLDEIEKEGADVAVLAHHDMYFRNGWLQKVKSQLAKLPDNWVCAGIIGKDMVGRMCGKFHDMRMVDVLNTSSVHEFPQEACCFDECVIIINMKKGFRFDETLDGFDLYGTLCVLQTWEMGGTAWVIDAFAEHYCMRPFSWFPDDDFKRRYKWLYDRYKEKFENIDSTVFVNKPRFETSAA
jgi:hypothetical protein